MNYKVFNDKVAFHPGYYIKEIIDDSGISIEVFADRLGTTPDSISSLVSGEQPLSNDLAQKLSNMLGTSVAYWTGLQKAYDDLCSNNEEI